MEFYDKTVNFVDTSFGGAQKPHFSRTVFWLEKFYPNFTESHKIAAYSHDIERAFRDKEKLVPEDYLDPEFLKEHQEGGAKIMAEFLQKNNAGGDMIQKVTHLISKHEVGGDVEQSALMDADSVSFFETNAENFVTKKAPIEGADKVKAKLDWMYNRISSDEYKKFAEENYKKWVSKLQ